MGKLKGREVADEVVGGPPPSQFPPCPIWWYKHQPNYTGSWAVFGDRVLPQLRKMKLIRGCNNVSPTGSMALCRSIAAEKGWQILEHDCDPSGKYLVEYEVAGGKAYVSRYCDLYSGTAAVRADQAGYYAFLGRLVDGGVVAQPQVWLLEALAEKYKQSLQTYASKGTAAGDARAQDYQRQLEVVLRTIAELYPDGGRVPLDKPVAEPAPKVPKRRAKAAPKGVASATP